MAITKLNKTFVKGAILKADELNDMVGKTNEIIDSIDEKIGATYFDAPNLRQLQFRNAEDRDAWLNGGGDGLILRSDQFSFSGTINQIKVTDDYGTRSLYFTTVSPTAEMTIGFLSQTKGVTDPSWTEVYEDFLVSVAVDKGSLGVYTNIITDKTVMNGDTLTFDIKKYIASGSNRVRVTAVGLTTGELATTIYSVTLTSMYISPSNFAWHKPFMEGETYSLGGMNIGGAISKKVMVRVTNTSKGYSATYEHNIGTATYTTNAYFFSRLEFPKTGTGTYEMEIWLDANGLESDHLVYNIMCIASADRNTAKAICINDLAQAVNGVDSALFKYAVYNGNVTTASPTIKIEKDGLVWREETLVDVPTSAIQTYSASLEFEDENPTFNIEATGILGTAEQTAVIRVDNSASFPAVAGASFYLNAATRNNAQENKLKVLNEANGNLHNVTWTNMAWVDGTDGWTTDDSGRKCLLVPATCKGVVNYQPLAAQGNGKTIELAFKVKNASDYNENIITFATNPTASNFIGTIIKPKKIVVHSRDLYTNDERQSYPTKEDELMHVVITIVKNYKTNYGNICIIYVNGVKKCSFDFTNSDSFATGGSLTLGSETADLFLYKMRVYDSGFGWQDVVQNYINCLPSQVEKIAAFNKINSILDDSYKVDYDAVYGKYSTMVIEMKDDAVIPDLKHPAGGKCDLWVNIINPKSGELDSDFTKFFNGSKIANQTIDGQGTTAMTYYRWNLRWKMDSTYNKRRITAKKNVASSMQDHKMGATRMFNDLHNAVVGKNEANARVAVFQYPVYGFERKLVDGTTNEYVYESIGIYTIGPDKGDDTTFGYNHSSYKTTCIHMEGTDHTPISVGMDYPWAQTKFLADKAAMGAILTNTTIDASWEVGMAGGLDTESTSDQAAVQTMLNTEFKPAYEVAYLNSPFIEGTTNSLSTINSQISTWRAKTNADGVSYSKLEFWTDGVYDLYYYNQQNKKYQATGINLLTDLGISTNTLSGMTLAQKNEYFKTKRRERFIANMGTYWHKDDCIFHYTFCLMFAATDNFKKNTYPYKFASLANGGKWRWRQDDLDTLFDINNQGFSAKSFSTLVGDQTSTGSGSVYRGDDSVFWTLIKECFKDEIQKMVHRIMDKMDELSPYGQSNLERIVGYVKSCCWDMAQEYFTKSAYNEDAEWTYEYPWYLKNQGQYDNDVHPLSQSLGSHYEAERDWVELRMVFLASYFQYGAFATDSGQDTSTGQISWRGIGTKTYNITPAVDFNPTILIGQSSLVSAGKRVLAGETISLTPQLGSQDTHIYVQGANYYADLGDLSDITVSADNPTFNVSVQRLQRLKMGDATASKVTSNVKNLGIGSCPSLVSIDARNLKSLVGAVDLSKCPRIKEALFSGSSLSSVNIPAGSKIVKLSLPDTLTTLSLVKLMNLTEANLSYGTMANLAYLRIESNEQMDGFEVLKTAYANSPVLKNIRIVGFEYDGNSDDIAMIATFATGKDSNGNPLYSGIDDDGNETAGLPVLDGSLSIDTPAYESDINNINTYYPNLKVSVSEFYIPFVDEVVKQLCAVNFGDGLGVTPAKAATVTSLNSVFHQNTQIKYFNEFEKFTGITNFNQANGFNGCTELLEIKLPKSIKSIGNSPMQNCSKCSYVVNLPNLTSVANNSTFRSSGVTEVVSLGSLKTLATSMFNSCVKLTKVTLNTSQTILGDGAFSGCTSLTDINIHTGITQILGSCFNGCTALVIESLNLPNLTSLGSGAFNNTQVKKVSNLGSIPQLGGFNGCKQLVSCVVPNTVTSIAGGAFRDCTALVSVNLPSGITTIGATAFYNCSAPLDLNLPKLSSFGVQGNGQAETFSNSSIKKISSLGVVSVIQSRTFYNCTQLESMNLPSTLVELKSYTFFNCTNLVYDVGNIPKSVTAINDSDFNGCSKFYGNLNLPNLKTLGANTFAKANINKVLNLGSITSLLGVFDDNKALDEVHLPSTLTTIQDIVFRSCTALRILVCNAITPPTLSSSAFQRTDVGAFNIYVPDSSVAAYKVATNWSQYASYIKPLSELS